MTPSSYFAAPRTIDPSTIDDVPSTLTLLLLAAIIVLGIVLLTADRR